MCDSRAVTDLLCRDRRGGLTCQTNISRPVPQASYASPGAHCCALLLSRVGDLSSCSSPLGWSLVAIQMSSARLMTAWVMRSPRGSSNKVGCLIGCQSMPGRFERPMTSIPTNGQCRSPMPLSADWRFPKVAYRPKGWRRWRLDLAPSGGLRMCPLASSTRPSTSIFSALVTCLQKRTRVARVLSGVRGLASERRVWMPRARRGLPHALLLAG